MDLTFLAHLSAELIEPGCERSEILAALDDLELRNAYFDVQHQLGLELTCGLYEHSHSFPGMLVIAANLGPIFASQTSFYAILQELDRRGLDWPDEQHR